MTWGPPLRVAAIGAATAPTAAAVVVVAGAAVDAVADPSGAGRTVLADGLADVRRATTRHGVRVVTEHMPEARSVTLGVWVGVGGRDEADPVAGASHFLEHLLFKGTERRSAHQIAESIDAVGGEMNAFTAQEHTAYHVRLPAAELRSGLELLADVCTAPAFRLEEVEAERQVILEEILLSEDEPDDRAHTLCAEALFPDHPLGREVLGSAETIEAMSSDDIAAFFAHHYRPANLVVAAAGRLDHDTVMEVVEDGFAHTEHGQVPDRTAPTGAPVPLAVVTRPTEQAHLAIGWRALSQDDPDRYALAVLNHVMGGGLSSRLFQEIREKRGLAYQVGSYTSLYADAGALVAYAGTSPGRLGEVKGLIEAEAGRLETDGITERELQVARGGLSGAMVLGLEDSGSRMARLGAGMVAREHVIPIDEHLARIAAVTGDDVARLATQVLGASSSVAAVGPIREADLT